MGCVGDCGGWVCWEADRIFEDRSSAGGGAGTGFEIGKSAIEVEFSDSWF